MLLKKILLYLALVNTIKRWDFLLLTPSYKASKQLASVVYAPNADIF